MMKQECTKKYLLACFKTDKYFDSEEEKEKMANLQFNYYQQHGCFQSAGTLIKWFGCPTECPTCKMVRMTDRCACMCGSCYTCGYRFVCNPISFDEVNWIKFDITDKIKIFSLADYNKLKEAAEKLASTLEEIHNDERYKSVWNNYAIHGGKYSGPFYVDQLENLKKVLKEV